MRRSAAALLAALMLFGGCGTKPTDYPLAAGQANAPQSLVDGDPERPFVVLTFSGGGSRAAVLAAAVVKRLNELHYTAGGQTRALAGDIAVVSSVSGGSVYAADLGLRGPEHAAAFEQHVQGFNGIGWLATRFLDPVTWIALQLESTTRIDLLQEMVADELLQSHATLTAFDGPGRPLILLNATDMVAGQVFTFDRQTLDDLCMAYDKVPVSLGVTASAAFPGAFTPVLLHDASYPLPGGQACAGRRNPNAPYRVELQNAGGPYANLEAYRTARYRQGLRNETVPAPGSGDPVPPYRAPVYLRLVDGGVADNSGLTALRRALLVAGGPADLGRLVSQGRLRHLVVIAVNARSDPKSDLDNSRTYTDLVTIGSAISGSLVDSASANSASVFNGFINMLTADRDAVVKEAGPQASFAVYPISIDFDQLPTGTAQERATQQRVKDIATSWTLQTGDAAALDHAAGVLLWRHPCFRLLVSDIGLQGIPEADAVTGPGSACPVSPPAVVAAQR